MNTTTWTAMGWRGSRVELERFQMIGCDSNDESFWSVDPGLADWHQDATEPPSDVYGWASNGASVVLSIASGLLVLGPTGSPRLLPTPAHLYSWGLLAPLPLIGGTGGYVVVGGAPKLLRLGSDLTTVSIDPIPKGYALAAPTSDPRDFILALASEAARMWGLSKEPWHAYLWDRGTGSIRLVAPSVFAVQSSSASLAYVTLANGDIRSLAKNGALTDPALPGEPTLWSPRATAYLAADTNSEASQSIALREMSTHQTIAETQASLGIVAWSGQSLASVAFVPRWVGASSGLVVLGPSGTHLVAFPTN